MLVSPGALTKAGVPTSGITQVETATIVGTVSGDGNALITVTGAGLSGSPLAINVPVLNTDSATVVAGKARTVLAANTAIAAFAAVSGTGANVVLTKITSEADDATLNIASANGTCTGLTAAPTSTTSTAGVKGDWRGCDHGDVCLDTTGQNFYKNTGTATAPVWTLI